jgi:hypothetical protein
MPSSGAFMLCTVFGVIQGYFSLPQGYPYQWGGYVYYPAPYIPPYPPVYSYPDSCCCYDYEIEPVSFEISHPEISADEVAVSEIAAQMTSTVDHPTTTKSTTAQLTARLRAETNTGISEKENYRFLQQTTIQSTTELRNEPKTISIPEISAELSTKSASESTTQSKTELTTHSVTETNTESITKSSKMTTEGTESTTKSTESATVTISKFTTKPKGPKQQSNTESTTKSAEPKTGSTTLIITTPESTIKINESTKKEAVSSAETVNHISETTAGSMTKSSKLTTRSTTKSTTEAIESTTETTADFKTEETTEKTDSTSDSIPKEINKYDVEEESTTSAVRSAEDGVILNTVTAKKYLLGRTTGVSAVSTGDDYQHLNAASNSELTTENNKVLISEFTTEIFSEYDTNDEISQTEDYEFPSVAPA